MMGRGGGAHAWSLTPSHLLHRAGLCSCSSLSTYSSLYLTLAGMCDSRGILSCTLASLSPSKKIPSTFTKTIYSQTLWQIVVLVSCSSPCLLCTSDVWSGCCYELWGCPFVVCCSTADSSCRGACCAVVRAAHKRGASLWQPVAHFTLTASVFTVINQWWPGGCHFALCGARPRLGSAPQTHSRPWWGDRAAHTHAHMHTLIDTHTPTGWAHTRTQKKLYAQHKAGCWSNYRNMAEHDEAGPTIRREIEWAEKKWWRH